MLGTELFAGLPAFVAGREAELSPYIRETLAGARGFEPSWTAYLAASGQLARLEQEADRRSSR